MPGPRNPLRDNMGDSKIFIGMLSKYELLYNLWVNAIPSRLIGRKANLVPDLNMEDVIDTIDSMIKSKSRLALSIYFGKDLHIDITGKYFEPKKYEEYNGISANKIVRDLKTKELKKSIVKYYTF